MLSPPTAYDGLYELSAECWRCCADAVYMASAAVPRFPIIGNAPGVFDDIRLFLQNLLNAVSGWQISSWVRNTMLPMVTPYVQQYVINPFNAFITTIYNSAASWWNWGIGQFNTVIGVISSTIRERLNSFRDYVHERLGFIAGTISDSLRSFREFINDRLSEIRGTIGDSLRSFQGSIYTRLWYLETSIGGGLASFRDHIYGGLASFRAGIYGGLMSLVATIGGSIAYLSGQLSMVGIAAVTQMWSIIVAGLSGLWLHLTSTCANIVIAATNVGKPIISGLWAGVSSIPSAYLSWLASTCGTDLALTPSRALASVGGLYGMA
ncbi:MAG: hypothetical protein Q8N51_20810, partial [Gammaproteobacteria bacterium]|nr:hypothetical protein [Gammaproteobacteria bacterium]